MQMDTPEAPEKITFERDYPGEASQASRVRADLAAIATGCPAAEDLILMASELVANATMHSRSGDPGGRFTVRANLYPGNYAWIEVIDQGGPWTPPAPGDEHGRGLEIVAAIAGPGNWGIDGGTSCHVAWFRLNWHQDQDQPS
jgi:anti-sigma regulatory factor (Ser/Thr protein kinase)